MKILSLETDQLRHCRSGSSRIWIVASPFGNDWLVDKVSAFSRERIDTLVAMLTDKEAEELGL